jgi:hypothetical protein
MAAPRRGCTHHMKQAWSSAGYGKSTFNAYLFWGKNTATPQGMAFFKTATL